MNRIFGIIFLLICLSCPAEAGLFGKKQDNRENCVFENTNFAKPVLENSQSSDISEVPQNELLESSIEDVDKNLPKTDTVLPANSSLINQSAKDEGNLFKRIFDIEGNIEAEFSLFDNFNLDKNNDNKIDEDTLIGKIINRDYTRTDVPSYLLREELTFRPEKGIVSKVQYFGSFQGDLSNWWNAGENHTSYDIGFVQVGAIGKFRNSNNDFKVLFNPRPVDGRTYMQNFIADAYIVNNSIPHHKVVIGYSRNQIGKEGGASSYILPFITRSQIARNFGSTRALGVRLIGNYSLMDYNLAFNSSDRYFHTIFAGPEFTGWVDFKPFGRTDGRYGKLILGGGLNAGHNKTSYTVGNVYIGYKYKRLWTNFEYGLADGYNGTTVSTAKAEGFNYTIGYKIHPRVQLIARYDQFDPNRNIRHNLRREYTAGINYFIKGQALRLILNYVFCDNQNTADSHRIILGTQILL